MLYTVKYRLPKQMFWRTIKQVKGDGVLENGYPARFFILADETRIELPASAELRFSKERFLVIKAQMEQQVGQAIPTAQANS